MNVIRTIEQAVELMSSSKNITEWNNNRDEVILATGNQWLDGGFHAAVDVSGLCAKTLHPGRVDWLKRNGKKKKKK